MQIWREQGARQENSATPPPSLYVTPTPCILFFSLGTWHRANQNLHTKTLSALMAVCVCGCITLSVSVCGCNTLSVSVCGCITLSVCAWVCNYIYLTRCSCNNFRFRRPSRCCFSFIFPFAFSLCCLRFCFCFVFIFT